jgi:hypothetical protein
VPARLDERVEDAHRRPRRPARIESL